MRAIFSGSQYAFSWLGKEHANTDLAFRCIVTISRVARQELGGGPRGSALLHRLMEEELFREPSAWVALQRLLEREF
jgi:hypothetical protein